jgi:hypothetical protein
MTNEESTKLVQGIFDGLYNAITKAEPGGKPISPPASTVLSLMKPGLAINSKDYRNPWTPGNSTGSKTAAVNTAALADVAPKMSALYTDSGNTVSQIYGQIMDNVQVPAQPPNPQVEAQLQAADAVLYRTISEIDPDTGVASPKVVDTPLYRDYKDNQAAYAQQRMAYVSAYLGATATQQGLATWPLVAPTLQIPVKAAFDKWRSAGADKVDQAIAIISTSSQNALSKAFAKAKQLFEGYGAVLDESGSGLGPLTQRSTLIPSDWHSANSSSKWTAVDSKSGSFSQSSSSEFTSGGGSAGFSAGIFSVSASGGASKQERHMSAETKDLRISYEYTLVTIARPWITFNLLGTQGWNLQNLYAKGKISNGTKAGQENSAMPILPTGFVAVRNVVISAQWSKADLDFIKKTVAAGGDIGIGPFKIGGSYASSKTSESFKSAFAGNKIQIPGVHVLCWIGQITRLTPPN